MNQVMESVLTVCVALVAAELLRRFCPEDQMVRFVSGLVALGLLLSLVGAVTGLELDLPLSAAQGQRQQEELSSYLGGAVPAGRPAGRGGLCPKPAGRRLGCRQKKSRFPQIETKMAA